MLNMLESNMLNLNTLKLASIINQNNVYNVLKITIATALVACYVIAIAPLFV